MRDGLIQPVTSLFYDLVMTYPNIAFHGGSQRLGVGTLEGSIVIYDLKTATRWQVLEGHTRQVTAISFSSDGRLIASFSLEENCVKFWQTSTNFFGSLAGAFGASSGAKSDTSGGMKSFRSFQLNLPPRAERTFEIRG